MTANVEDGPDAFADYRDQIEATAFRGFQAHFMGSAILSAGLYWFALTETMKCRDRGERDTLRR